MENLLDVDAEERALNTFERIGKFCRKSEERRNDKSARRRGSYMVRVEISMSSFSLGTRLGDTCDSFALHYGKIERPANYE